MQIHSCGAGVTRTQGYRAGRMPCPLPPPHKKITFMQKWGAPVPTPLLQRPMPIGHALRALLAEFRGVGQGLHAHPTRKINALVGRGKASSLPFFGASDGSLVDISRQFRLKL